MNTRQKLTLGIAAIFMVTLTIVGVTYAYFVTRVTGENNTESVNVQTATVGDIVYNDGNGPVTLMHALPGQVTYKSFTVANLGQQAQPFKLFVTTSVPNVPAYKATVTGEENPVEYPYGEFIHTATGNNDKNVDAGVDGCYAADAKRSTETGASTICFDMTKDEETDTYTSVYNNIKISLYKLGENEINNIDTTNKTYSVVGENPFAEYEIAETTPVKYDFAGVESLTALSGIPTQVYYNGDTTLDSQIMLPGEKVYSYVLKVEYLDTKNNTFDYDDNQNAENLAALSILVDISA